MSGTPETQSETLAAALEVLDENRGILVEKNSDYGDAQHVVGQILSIQFPDGVTLETPQDFKRFGLYIRILDKVSRMGTLGFENADRQVDDETIVDTGADLANYATLFAADCRLGETTTETNEIQHE